MKIKVIAPIISDIFNDEMMNEFSSYVSPQTEIGVANLEYGPASVESEYDEVYVSPTF
ncbi:hypothetical protein [Cytobacillus purgationiresistens]|uniref:Asp/Glu/hydantoin racemase n=1 Tax=Cytobacillus purgationiresistens TaxID=863449 RepID=A0ABU0AND1_9BACI|nr:hypothetical protein [Cytobacillus purgationiresistens]MDQ0272786.1 Asp/Glu/hydantoin racemase [Cytobacillus purgationiresistens]